MWLEGVLPDEELPLTQRLGTRQFSYPVTFILLLFF